MSPFCWITLGRNPYEKADCDLRIQKYEPKYARQVADLFQGSVHETARRDYTQEELEAWAPTPVNYKAWSERLSLKKPWLIIEKETVTGFAELESDGHVDCFYIHQNYQGQHLGTTLMNRIEAEALEAGLSRLYLEASITARPFFEKMGFVTVGPNLVRKGSITLKNYRMEKVL